MQIEGKVAVVTGGSSGIGLGLARRLKANGAQVVLVGRNAQALEAAARETDGLALQADVTDRAALATVADRAVERFGKVDLVVNNAGAGPVGRLAGMTLADWRWMLDTNLGSVINGLDVFLPLLRRNLEGGHVVNTASIAGLFTAPGIGGYAATKSAVVAISETLAMEMGRDNLPIGVTVFLPGPVRSSIHASLRNRAPDSAPSGLHDSRLEDMEGFENVAIPWMEADDAADRLISAIRRDDLYAWTHPEMAAPIRERFCTIVASLDAAVAERQLR